MISFCITCRDRLWQLKETLGINLRHHTGANDVEFVLLNYNSSDELEDWVQTDRAVRAAIGSGLLAYWREATAPYFHSPRAKNIAHRVSSGDIVCNLDADNWVAGLRESILANERNVFHGFDGFGNGTYGRIAMPRDVFYAIRGYDEDLLPMSHQDKDILIRASAYRWVTTQGGCMLPVQNTIAQKVAATGITDLLTFEDMQRANEALMRQRRPNWVCNPLGWAKCRVSKNFGPYVDLEEIGGKTC